MDVLENQLRIDCLVVAGGGGEVDEGAGPLTSEDDIPGGGRGTSLGFSNDPSSTPSSGLGEGGTFVPNGYRVVPSGRLGKVVVSFGKLGKVVGRLGSVGAFKVEMLGSVGVYCFITVCSVDI